MIEIETSKGFAKLPIYPKTLVEDGGVLRVEVVHDESADFGLALSAANGGTANFRIDGTLMRCGVEFQDSPMMEAERVSYFHLRLTSQHS